jgi:hypothetical protein
MDGHCVCQGEVNQITKYLEKLGNKTLRFANPADIYETFFVSYPINEKNSENNFIRRKVCKIFERPSD